MNANPNQLYLKPDEGLFLGMAVVYALELIEGWAKNQKANWTPEARRTLKEMQEAGQALKKKLVKLGFDLRKLPDYNTGDEDEFLTKPS